jgi:hypothetical protein
MFTKFAVGALVGGSLTLLTAGMAVAPTPAGASTPSTPAATQFNWANAQKALTRVQKVEGRIDLGLPKLTAAQQRASSNGHTKLAARLQKRITRFESASFKQRLQTRSQKIEMQCNLSAPSGS